MDIQKFLKENLKVSSLKNNQYILEVGNITVFQSYDSKICAYDSSTSTLYLYGDIWDYSNTTRKYFKEFINYYTIYTYEDKKEWLKMIERKDKIVYVKSSEV